MLLLFLPTKASSGMPKLCITVTSGPRQLLRFQVNTTATCCYHIVLDCSTMARPFTVSFANTNLTFQARTI